MLVECFDDLSKVCQNLHSRKKYRRSEEQTKLVKKGIFQIQKEPKRFKKCKIWTFDDIINLRQINVEKFY